MSESYTGSDDTDYEREVVTGENIEDVSRYVRSC